MCSSRILVYQYWGCHVWRRSFLDFDIEPAGDFPVLLLTLFWRGFTPQGAIAAGLTGSLAALSCIVAGPTVWVVILGNPAPLFPLENPALVSVPLALLAGLAGSFRAAKKRLPNPIG